jgi:hypothetical protein
MSNILKPYVWVSLTACLAIALAAANAVAQQEESQDQSNQDQQQSSDDQTQQTRQSDSQTDQSSQEQQSQQSDQQRTEQQRQREEQERQRQQQDRQRDQQSRDDSAWPSPNRYESDSDSRQWSRSSEFSRDAQRSASSQRSRQGGLGVNIATDEREGVVVRHVHRGSPAEEMGIRTGDRITQVNGQEVNSTREFVQTIRNMDPGEEVELDIRRARGGGEQTVRGELETRGEALAEHSGDERGEYRESQWSEGPSREFGGQSDRYTGQQNRDNWQTSYEEEEQSTFRGQRSGQMSSERIQQLERQVDRLSQQIDDLRQSLQDLRRQGREQTARYDEFESQSPRRSATRWDNTNRYRQSDRSRTTTGRSGEFGLQRSRDGQFSRDAARPERVEGQRSEFDDSAPRTYESRRIDPDQSSRTREANEPESPGGEIGSDRQHVGTEDIQE